MKFSIRRLSRWLLLCLLINQTAFALHLGRIPVNALSLYVWDLKQSKLVLEHQVDQPMNPASVMKLITTFVALKTLGPNYQWHTQWKTNGFIVDGVLHGDLFWVGSGNPVLDLPDIEDMQLQLKMQGIQDISGQVVMDSSVWDTVGSADGFDADFDKAFTSSPNPHMVAYNVLWLTAQSISREKIQFDFRPLPIDLVTDVQVAFSPFMQPCRRLSDFISMHYVNHVLSVQGKLPQSCLGKSMFVYMRDARHFAEQSFRQSWLKLGGHDLTFRDGLTPKNAVVLAENYSKPLRDILVDMNQFSNNIIARSLFLRFGQTDSGSRGVVQRAKQTVQKVLQQSGSDTHDLVLENGSGLSRKERVTAQLVGELLKVVYVSPIGQEFVQTLPIAGVSGTLKNRFLHTSGQLYMKTGTLDDVRALAGYWLPDQITQHPLVIVALLNINRSTDYSSDFDGVVEQIIQEYGMLEKSGVRHHLLK